jgi:protein TonB
VARPPVLVHRVVPVYPPAARRRGIVGMVRLEAILDIRGHVEESIRVVQSIPDLDAAATEALRQWRFAPARDQAGEPVRVVLEVPINFVLR